MTSTSSTESKPLAERLLPQTSIRFFLLLIGFSAVVMVTVRAALIGDQFWAKIVSLLLAVIGATFLAYAVLFFLANIFSASTAPLVRSGERRSVSPHAQSGDDSSTAVGEA